MVAIGESDPAYPGIQDALKAARAQAQVKPVQDRIGGTELSRERRVEGGARHSRRSLRGSPEEVEQISPDAIARFGDVFTTPVGHCPPRDWQGVVFGDGDSDRPGRVFNAVWPFRSKEFFLRRGARYGLMGVRIGEASHPGSPKLCIVGSSQGEVPSTVPASDGALEAIDRGRVVAMDSDTESVRSGIRSHHSYEDAFEMDLDAVSESEVGSAVDDEVSVVSGEVEILSVEEVFEVPELRDTSPQIRAAFRWMDAVDVEELFRTKAAVFRSIQHFLRGPFQIAMRTALAEAIATCPASSRMEVISVASQDVTESPAKRRTCEQREIAKTFRTLQCRSMGGVDSGQRESCRSGEQCIASTGQAPENRCS